MSETKFTKGPWKVEHMGGSSTVLVPVRPRYNNTATPSYGYRDGGPFSVATIFQEDGGHIRRDFVAFSHDDAHLIAAAPELYEALANLVELTKRTDFSEGICCCGDSVEGHGFGSGHSPVDAGLYYATEVIETARTALAKARGEA